MHKVETSSADLPAIFLSIVKASLLNVTNVFLWYHLTDSNQFLKINASSGQFLGYCILQSRVSLSPSLNRQMFGRTMVQSNFHGFYQLPKKQGI